eukprot:scaffold4.g4901.t1
MAGLPLHRWRHQARRPPPFQAAADDEEPPTPGSSSNGSADPAPAPAAGAPPPARAVALRRVGVPTAGAAFFLAGFLKLLIMCFPYSPMSVAMFVTGRADLGVAAVVKMLPLALALAAGAKALLDRGLHKRPWVRRGILLGAVAALVLSRWIFARPSPSPLDPMFARMQQQQAAAVTAAAQQQAQAAARSRLLPQPSEAARGELPAARAGRWSAR